jgi:hypothetical protein
LFSDITHSTFYPGIDKRHAFDSRRRAEETELMSADELEQKPSSIQGYYSEVGSELCLLSIKRGKEMKEKVLSNKRIIIFL